RCSLAQPQPKNWQEDYEHEQEKNQGALVSAKEFGQGEVTGAGKPSRSDCCRDFCCKSGLQDALFEQQLGRFMKRASLILALALSFAAVSPIFAANQTKDTKANKSSTAKEPKKTKPQSSSKQIALTGSYIKRDTNHNGLVTDGPNPVYVL